MSEKNNNYQKLFLEKKYSEIIRDIENKDKIVSAGLLNLLGVCKLLRNSKDKNDLFHANEIFKEAYLLEKKTKFGLESVINFINSSANIFSENYNANNNNLLKEAEIYFKEAEINFGFNEKLILAIIRIYKRQNNIKNTLYYLKKLIDNNYTNPKVLCSFIYRNCFIKNWKQEDFLNYSKLFNKILKNLEKSNDIQIKIKKKEKINLAFLSSDIKENHSITFFLKTLLLNYNKEKFKITLIANSELEDETTIFFKSLVDDYIKLSKLNDNEALSYVRGKNFDVIFDLMGVTSSNRLTLFKNRMAPIQISWLGYCNTTGIEQMDYLFADKNTIFKNEENLYSEKVIYLPKIWNCHSGINQKRNKINSPLLSNKFITFASFNNFNKINEDVIRVWSEILNKVKNSKLILKSSIKMQTDIIKNQFEKKNVLDSVIFLEKKTFNDHLNLYNSVDISLDTFPYNGVTTSFESIWTGVPVLTMKGYNFNSRCGESINKNLNLEYLIAQDENDYISKAVHLSNNIDDLVNIRNQVFDSALNTPLFDKDSFSKDFFRIVEDIYNSH